MEERKLSPREKAAISVAEKMGISPAEADRIMTAAKRKYGIRYVDFDKHDFHNVPDCDKALKVKQIALDKEKRENLKEMRAACATLAMEKCGMSEEEAQQAFLDAKANYGLNAEQYLKYEFCCLTPEERENVLEEIKLTKENNKLRVEKFREQCITLAMEKMGWSREEAEKDLDETRKRLGCGYIDYRRYHLFSYPKDELPSRYLEIIGSRENRKSRDDGMKEKFFAEIMEKTGWTEAELEEKVEAAYENCQASWKDYYTFRFWEIPEEEQLTYFTQHYSLALADKYDTNDFHRDILLNKELSCYQFSEFFRRPWCINRDINREEFAEKFHGEKKLVYKPLDGNGGIGIIVFDNNDHTYDEIMKLPRGVVEGFVVQHPEMNKLTPNSVNTLRIVGVHTDEFSKIAYAALRCGSGKSVVDNFTDGGMVAGIDLATGTVVTNCVTITAEIRENHPETGTAFKGFVIPYFKEALELVEAASKKITGYLGWDVAISENGPVLIEANIMPGNRILQMPYVEDRKGMRHIMAEFLEDK